MKHKFIKQVYSQQTGGGIYVDYVVLKSGRVIGVTDESVCIYADEEQAQGGQPVESFHLPAAGVPMLTFDQWFEKYKPVKNHIDTNASGDGCAFETYGAELEFVKAADPKKVWTWLDCDGKAVISAGYHHVNRMNYFITELPFETDLLEVKYE